MAHVHTIRHAVASLSAVLTCATAATLLPAVTASADTYSDLVNARNSHAASVQRENELRAQLNGVNQELADKILELNDLTNNKIVAAQEKVTQANEAAAAAQSDAEAAANRLAAAQKDKQALEEQIKKTGKDYDDAHAAVAQLAREEMHGSDASDVMSVVTGSSSTKDFINSMQSRDAVSRNEANAASSAATTLNTSMNRSERLAAIEQRISELKAKADEKSAAAQTSAAAAQSERDQLDQLRQQGEAKRDELNGLVSSLDSQVAQQAAKTVLIQSEVDSFNRQYQSEQAASAGSVSNGAQGSTGGGLPTTPPTASSGGSGQGTSNGDYGNAYYPGQCTWWAYNRRKQMGIGTPSYLGNGGDWWSNASRYGLRVDHNPEVGAALSFIRGQDGADRTYGHVAVVEAVYGDGTFQISEMNVYGEYVMSYRTLRNSGQYWFVH